MSYLFSASAHKITYPDAAALDVTGTYTMVFWCNLTSAGGSMVPLQKAGNYGAYFAYEDAGRIENTLTKGSGTGLYRAVSTTAVPFTLFIGGWHFIVLRGTGDAPLTVRIDGVDRTEGGDNYWFAETRDLTQPLVLGNRAAADLGLFGYLAEVAIWNTTSISDANADAMYTSFTSPMDLSTPPSWYARLKTDAVEHISSAAGTISGAAQNAAHPPVLNPGGGGGGSTSPRNNVFAFI